MPRNLGPLEPRPAWQAAGAAAPPAATPAPATGATPVPATAAGRLTLQPVRQAGRRLQIPRLFPGLTGYLMVAPALAIIGAFTWMPVGVSAALSLFRWDMMRPTPRFVGVANFRRLMSDPAMAQALGANALYALGTVLPGAVLGLGLALLLNQRLRGTTLLRAAFFAPVVTSAVSVFLVWTWILHPEVGLLNAIIGAAGLGPVRWLGDPRWAIGALALVGLWKNLGYLMIIFLAGLQQIPPELHEAAAIDGASGWQRVRYVTLPLLAPTTFFVLVISTLDALQLFTQVDVMTQGGPAGSTTTAVYYLYFRGFRTYEMGYASAIALALFIPVLALTYLHARWQERREGATCAASGGSSGGR